MSTFGHGGEDPTAPATDEQTAQRREWIHRYRNVRKPRNAPSHRLPATILVDEYTAYAHGRRWRPEQTPLSDEGGIELLVTDEWLTYDIEAATTDCYALTFSVAAADGFGGGELGIVVDGDPRFRFSFDATGGWDTWNEIQTALELTDGQHTLQLVVLEGGWKLAGLTLR